ncbi:sensor histidine kinase [Spirosoma soli]|uniref:Sensor histidine kinase n=1 Tax=Spirosoma soli TaxID=1770529 RepID=A0ABW5MAG9_9BACT
MNVSKSVRAIGLNSLGWTAYIFYYTSAIFAQNPNADLSAATIIGLSVYYIVTITFFYACYYFIFPRLFEQKNYVLGSLLYVIAVGVFMFIDYNRVTITNTLVTIPEDERLRNESRELFRFAISAFYDVVQVTAISLTFWYFRYNLKLEHQRASAQRQQLLAEVNFLKSQIDQHFLYNTLNMFYSKASLYSADLANAILSLSNLLRFVVTTEFKTMVPLEHELRSINLFTELNQLRFNNKLLVEYQTKGDLSRASVPPLCLLTLVENAFKHGDLKREPLLIDVRVDDQLTVHIRNRKHTAQMPESTNVGLANTRKRLNLLFGEQYKLIVHQDDTYFDVSITLNSVSTYA